MLVEPHLRGYDLEDEANDYKDVYDNYPPFNLVNNVLVHLIVIDVLQLIIEDVGLDQGLGVDRGINRGLLN